MTTIEPVGDNTFDWRQERFQEWLALPQSERPPEYRTQIQVAEALGVHPHTLTAWKQLPGFWDAVYNHARSIVGGDLSEILSAMVKEARKGSVSAAKLCLQILGVFEEEQTHKIEWEEPLTIILSPDRLGNSGNPPKLEQPTSKNSLTSDVVDGEVRAIKENVSLGLEIVYADEE